MSSQHVIVTYASAPSFLSSDHWQQIHSALIAQLPLRNIHWKPATKTSVRTIQELSIRLASLESVRDEHTSQIPSTLLEKPLLNIYIVLCEDNETYKTVTKKQIKDWHTIVSQRKNQEWLIVHVVRPDARTAAGGFFQMKGTVLDKIKADFNLDKRDRCVQLAWTVGQNNPAAWAEMLSKIKEGILVAFDSTIAQRSEEVKRSAGQRLMPGWNYCTFFILKESIATSFEGMNLFEDALLQFDDLDIMFTNVLREKNMSWFGQLIVAGPKDDSAPLLSVSSRPYRDLILANTISVFDFRIYIIARQCLLLAKMGRVDEVCRKTHTFLVTFSRRLRDIQSSLPHFFLESWIYSSALSTVEQCDVWAKELTLDGATLVAFNASKADLLELARSQLDVVGVKVGHLPSKPPFSLALITCTSPPTNGHSKHSSGTISNQDVVRAMADADTFYDLYIGLTNRAIELYAKGNRRKFALKLHGSLAALDLHRKRLSPAFQTFSSLPAHYLPHQWTSLESYMLVQAIDTHRLLGTAKDRQWVDLALSFLGSYVDELGEDLLMQETDKTAYVGGLVKSLGEAVGLLDTDMIHHDFPAISLRIATPNARLAESKDGSFLDVTVRNRLPCDMPVDEIAVVLTGRESERLIFSTEASTLPPGTTTFSLFCPTSSWGNFLFDSSEIRASRLRLQWAAASKPSSAKAPKRKFRAPVLVRLIRDLHAFEVRIQRPHRVELGKPPQLMLIASSGRNNISRAEITLTSASGVEFRPHKVVLEHNDEEDIALEATEQSLSISNLKAGKSVYLLVPHTDASSMHMMQVDISAEYSTEAEPSVKRTLLLGSRIPTSLPIAVNVHDFFRGSRLFSKFTISTAAYQHVRLASASLEADEGEAQGLVVRGTLPQKRNIATITPSRPVNIVFQMDSKNGRVGDPLWLCIKYRMLRDEIEALIEHVVDTVLDGGEDSHLTRTRLVNSVVKALEKDSDWVYLYDAADELVVPEIQAENDYEETLQMVIQTLRTTHPNVLDESSWREIRIPVDVPQMNILAAARLSILSSPFSKQAPPQDKLPPLYAGQPISALLTIHTSFKWSMSYGDESRRFKMRFDIEELVRDWLVSGRKRGDFEAKNGETYTVPITLIALHHGELSLPKVSVTALPVGGEMTMGSLAIPSAETYQVHGAEKVLVLPRGGRTTFVIGMGEPDIDYY
ncbi:uncharacterized protein STEHIDRAFT_92528 [Stereum hirsutum FP-91666 SS1]|uniref:uncharacterized protein n=1 Tax=Stereum hirsutum (strain FP-91666) TaxID=721885 RepID=UPI000440E8B5|nr:uncharacterized protein STEHIDRAFT_92528 [Stereum hirsutum FP-91666 SS1]EIM89936.1 hypothetical protein STEHIDRAFT_92528 [Stereum hirsutum FP-91666 SS1]